MNGTPLRTPLPRHAAVLAAPLALALLLGACSDEPATTPTEDPSSAAASPTTPELLPVAGDVTVAVVDASQPELLGFADDGDGDETQITAASDAVAGVLDAYLETVQRGEPDTGLLRGNWLQGRDRVLGTITTQLATPDQPVRRAVYDMTVQVEDRPTLVTARITVERADGSTAVASMTFAMADGTPVLHLVGAGGDA